MADKSAPAPADPARKVRRTRLSRQVIEALVRATEAGLPAALVADAAACSERSVRRWRARARRGEKGLVGELGRRLQAAESAWLATHLKVIHEAATGRAETVTKRTVFPDGSRKVETQTRTVSDWRASCWLLAHKFPDQFGTDHLKLEELDKMVDSLAKQVQVLDRKPPLEDLLGRLPPEIERQMRATMAEHIRQDKQYRLRAAAARIGDAEVREEFERFLASREVARDSLALGQLDEACSIQQPAGHSLAEGDDVAGLFGEVAGV